MAGVAAFVVVLVSAPLMVFAGRTRARAIAPFEQRDVALPAGASLLPFAGFVQSS